MSKHKVEKQKGRSLEEALKDYTITGGASNWQSNDPSFNVLMSEMGVKLNDAQQNGMNPHNTSNQSEQTVFNNVATSWGKRSPIRGEGISPDPKRINRRPSGSTGNVSKCRKRLQISKPKENKEINLKLNALQELKKAKKVKSPTAAETNMICDTDDKDDVLCDILNELTNDVKSYNKQENADMDIQQCHTQCLPVYKKTKQHGVGAEQNSKKSELICAANSLNGKDDIDSKMLLNDIIDELTQSASSNSKKHSIKHKLKRSKGPEIYDSQMDGMLSPDTRNVQNDDKDVEILEENFKSLSPFKYVQVIANWCTYG